MSTTRFPTGVTNIAKESTLGMMGQPDPTKYNTFFDDFHRFNSADWTITTTEAGAGSATEALTDGDGGILLITNDNADNDNDFFQKLGESFRFAAGKKMWFKARFKVSDATQSDFVIGLQITDTSPLAVTDGVYFMKDDGDANLDFHITKDSTSTSATAISTVSNDTYLSVGFHYNGVDEMQYFVDDVKIGTSAVTNLPNDEDLTISFGLQNGEAAAKTMSLDYILVVKER